MRYLDHVSNEHFDLLLAKNRDPRNVRPEMPADDATDVELRAWGTRVKQRAEEHERMRRAEPEVLLHAILMNEVDYVHFTGRKDEQGKKIRVHYWQVPMLLDNIVVAYCGRDVGKSTTLKWSLEHRATNFATGSLIVSGNQDARVKKIWTECVMKDMRSHWWARHFFDNTDGAQSSRNPYHQFFLGGKRNPDGSGGTGFMLYGIPASEQTAHKVESPHCHGVVIDEMQEYAKITWEKLLPAVNDYESNREHGAMHKFFGVNSQGRIDTVFHEIAFSSEFYAPHRYTIASWLNPKYNLGTHIKYLTAYDWSIESSRFKQMIRGMVGERNRGLVSSTAYNACNLVAARLKITDRNLIRIDKAAWLRSGNDPEHLFTQRTELKKWDGEFDMTVLSMDYGSSNPSEIGIWHKTLNPSDDATNDNKEVWLLWQRISIQGLQGQDQAFIIDYLDTFYDLDWLAVDSTGATDTISQLLTDVHNPLYAPKNYRKRLYPAVSNKFIPVRYEAEEPEDRALCPAGTRWKKVELTGAEGAYRIPVWALEQNSNVLSSNFVAQLIEKRILAISGGDTDLQAELLSITEKIIQGSQPQYVGLYGLHRFSMMRSFAQWVHQHFVLKALQREILGEDEEEYYAGYGTPLVGFGRVKLPIHAPDGGRYA